MYNFLPHTDASRKEMLNEIGAEKIEDLFNSIDAGARLRESLNLNEGVSELEAHKKLSFLAQKNKTASNSTIFMGGGTYNRFIPSCIATIVQRSEFITAYTPYQPEISQGTLQVMYEYQSMLCNLTGMDVANASVYDGASACAEAILMAARIKRKSKVLVPSTLNPDYAKVIESYCFGANIEVDYLPSKNGITDIERLQQIDESDEYACILIQNPNYLGCIEDVYKISENCQRINALFIVCADPLSFALIESADKYNADIVVGDIQSFGIPMSFGGPHGGFIACTSKHMRQLPGRIAGMTLDKDGNRAFTLTLQAREQHIRREKATSNICSNQALIALSATVYLSVMGIEGLKEVATISMHRAHFLAEKINSIPGFKVLFSNFLNEFVIKIDDRICAQDVLDELETRGMFAGINLSKKFEQYKNCILSCVTEINSVDDIYFLINSLKEISSKHSLEVSINE